MTAGEDFKKPSTTVKNRRRRPPIPYWSGRRRPPIPNILKGEMRDVRMQLQSLAKDALGTQVHKVLSPNQISSTAITVNSDMDQRLQETPRKTSHLVPAPKVSPMMKVKKQEYSDNFLEGEGSFAGQIAEVSQSEHNSPTHRYVNSAPAVETARNNVTPEQTPRLKDKEGEDCSDKCVGGHPSEGSVATSKSGSLLEPVETCYQLEAFDSKSELTEALGLPQRYSTVDSPFSASKHHVKSQKQSGVERSAQKMPEEGRRTSVHSDTKSSKNRGRKIPYRTPESKNPILMSQSSSLASDYRDSIVHSETVRTANTFIGDSEASMLRTPIVAVEQVAPFSHISPYNHCIARRPMVQSPFCGEVCSSKTNVLQNMDEQSYTDQLWVQQSNHHNGGLIFANGGNQQLGAGAGVPIYYFRPPGASMIYGNGIPQNNGYLPQQFSNQPGVILQQQQTLNPMAYHQPQNTFYQPYSYPYQF